MFGQKDDKENTDNTEQTDPMQAISDDNAQLLANEPAVTEDVNNAGPPPVASAATAPATDTAWQHPGAPLDNAADANTDQIKDVISPAGGYPSSPNTRIANDDGKPFPLDEASSEDAALVSTDDVSSAELVDIKQKALSELVPLIDKLDQPPEEKFRTIMMMIQASDDQRLVEKAYESAHSIENEEARAQALLDIVNEINYFTQQPEN